MKLNIEYSRDEYLTESGKTILKDRYYYQQKPALKMPLLELPKHLQMIKHMHKDCMIMLVSCGLCFLLLCYLMGGTTRGLPISCFLNYVDDSREGLADHYTENIWLSSMGGGIGGYWGDVRSQGMSTSIGNKTTGVIPFMHVVDSQMDCVSSRRN